MHIMNKMTLHTVYQAVVMVKLLYAAPALCGSPPQVIKTVLLVFTDEKVSKDSVGLDLRSNQR